MTTEAKFQQLCEMASDAAILQSTMALLEWDQQTKMPQQGGEYRAKQITYLAGELHRKQTDPRMGELLEELEAGNVIDDEMSDIAVCVRELKRDFDKKSKLPEELVRELASATSMGQQVWIEARKENDFGKFSPLLSRIFELKREQADAVGFEDCRYDALLDDYEPAASTKEVAETLDQLKGELVPLVQKIGEASTRPDASILSRDFCVEQQRQFGEKVSRQIGFDYSRGRLDVTHHPFCTELGPNDVRITTRYDKSFFNMSFFGTLHEAGHGIYEQGLRGDQYGLPTGKYCSLGIHESQSRLWENLVGRSRGFWDHFYADAQTRFDVLSDVDQEQFFGAINATQPSLIRVEADEATYNLHIIIRFQLENELLNEELQVDDLPAAWNQKYENYLGVKPDSDANGVMQDIHWSAGLVGYFPTYSLGNIYASQLYSAAENELGNLQEMFARGEFLPLKNWLNEKVHQLGQTRKPAELMKQITGSAIDQSHLMAHLSDKLLPIYGL